ncbi:MAG: tetratricopeptide repeat protein [Prevotellaceae bacterium]|jgi:tetratricopeptide (TPR) repeat protein|nr:tetratricopeptide repeat protein [Prevotellaceae bacterium]
MKRIKKYVHILIGTFTYRRLGVLASVAAAAMACSGKIGVHTSAETGNERSLKKQYYFTEGLRYYTLQDYSKANAFFRQALKEDSTCDACYYRLAEMYLQAESPEEAVAFSRAAMALDTANVWYQMLLGSAYTAAEDFDSAVAVYKDVLQKYPQYTELYYQLAGLYAERQEYTKALAQLDSLNARTGTDEEMPLMRFEILQRMGDREAALATLRRIGETTSDARIFSMLGETYNNMGDDTLALTYFEHALTANPNFAPAMLGEADVYRRRQLYDVFFQKLQAVYAHSESPAEMKTNYLTALLSVPQFVSVFRKQLDTLFGVWRTTPDVNTESLYGSFLIRTGNADSALAVFKNAAQLFRTDVGAWETYLGYLYYRKSWDSLSVHAAEALTVFPRHNKFTLMNAVALWHNEKALSAIDLLENYLAKGNCSQEQKIEVYALLGDLYHEINNDKKAYRYYEKVLAIDSANVLVLNNYAYSLSGGGKQLDKAYEMSQKTILAEPDNATYLDTFGWILYKMGRFVEAKAIFRHAITCGGTDNAVILDHFGDVFYALGEKDSATLYWERSYKKEADSEVKKKIDTLR